MEDVVSDILAVFKKRRYSRGTPHNAEEMAARLTRSIVRNEPIKLVGFWGVGPKPGPNRADEESCAFLNRLNDDIKKVYAPGIEFTFILAMEHGIYNGYQPEAIQSYTTGIQRLFGLYGFQYIHLSSLWKKYDISFEKIEHRFSAMPDGWWEEIGERHVIERNAANRNMRLPARLAAQRYFIMRQLEKKMFELEFPDHIFHAFSDPTLKDVLPDMPTLYLFSRNKWSNTPWFA